MVWCAVVLAVNASRHKFCPGSACIPRACHGAAACRHELQMHPLSPSQVSCSHRKGGWAALTLFLPPLCACVAAVCAVSSIGSARIYACSLRTVCGCATAGDGCAHDGGAGVC